MTARHPAVDCLQSVAELSRKTVKNGARAIFAAHRPASASFFICSAQALATVTLKNWAEELMRNERLITHARIGTLNPPRIRYARSYLLRCAFSPIQRPV